MHINKHRPSPPPELKELDNLVEKMIDQSPEKRPNIDVVQSEFVLRLERARIAKQILAKQNELLIKEIEEDDPILKNPVEITKFDWDENGNLLINFNHQIPNKWHIAFFKVGGPYNYDISPKRVVFTEYGAKLKIPESDSYIRSAKQYISEWIPQANRNYKEMIIQERITREQEKREMIKLEIQKKQRHTEILEILKKK